MVFTLIFLFTDQRLSGSPTLSSKNMVYFPLTEMVLDWYFYCRGVPAISVETLPSVIVTYSGTAAKAVDMPVLSSQSVSPTLKLYPFNNQFYWKK